MTDGTPTQAKSWAVHFPGNLRWTNAMQIVKGMVPYGAVAMDEVDRVGRRLEARGREADLDRVWSEEWAAMADRVAAVPIWNHLRFSPRNGLTRELSPSRPAAVAWACPTCRAR